MASKTKKRPNKTTAIQATVGNKHIVGIGNLRVVLVEDDGLWFAQGLEIDYGAQGASVAEAKSHFEAGLRATIQQHLRIHGTIENMLQVAPSEVWKEVYLNPSAQHKRYSQLSLHDIRSSTLSNLPFEGIQYLQQV